jgi:hypothetical protein
MWAGEIASTGDWFRAEGMRSMMAPSAEKVNFGEHGFQLPYRHVVFDLDTA